MLIISYRRFIYLIIIIGPIWADITLLKSLFRKEKFSALQNDNGKIDYTLRFEQEEAVKKALEYFEKTEKGEFLWNAKPRFGKTLASYDLAKQLKANKVLIVTNRPAIANSWFDDFEMFVKQMIPRFLPTCHLESFSKLKEIIKTKNKY